MILTPLEYFLKWEKETPQKTFLRQPVNGKWIQYSYADAGNEVRRLASYFRNLQLPPESKVAILSKNCAHWIMTDLAIMMSGFISVPVYPTLSAMGVNQILVHSEATAIFLGKLDDFASQRAGIPPSLKKFSCELYGLAEGMTWEKIVTDFQPIEISKPPEPEKIATIMYSSGTTGAPKGVMLTHRAFGFVGEHVKIYLKVSANERFFSYLPLSHIAERALMEMVVFASGSTISFAESLDQFSANLQHERPTIFGGVPRIYSKFQEGILKKIPQKKLNRLLSIPIVNAIIKKAIRKKLGLSEARTIVCGAAPIPLSLLLWFNKLGIEIREIYGMTENTALSHANFQGVKFGSVGQPWPGVEAKLSPEGEILVRHNALMNGYFKDDQTTSIVFTPDGFLKTGDEGVIDTDGFLTITGRIKDQFKTDKAKFVAPAPIELEFSANSDVDQVCVVGMGLPQPIALVVPSAIGNTKSKEDLVKSIELTLHKTNLDLESYEKVSKVIILKTGWTIENGLLTPSLKVKRNEVEKIYHNHYPSWYKERGNVVWE